MTFWVLLTFTEFEKFALISMKFFFQNLREMSLNVNVLGIWVYLIWIGILTDCDRKY